MDIEATDTYQEILHFVNNNDPESIARNWAKEIINMKLIARESQEWDWLSAISDAEENGREYFEIAEMQQLFEKANSKI